MNSNSRNYYNDDCDPCRKDPCKKEKDKKKDCPVIIKCGAAGSATVPAIAAGDPAFSATLTSLTLDTSCLCDPCTKLEFTSNLISTGAFTGAISFQVFKQCNNQFTPVPVGPAFTFSRGAAAILSDTFTFFVCDCASCHNDCCTYTVVITANAIVAIGLTITNATLGAISTCQSSCSKC